MHVRIITVVCSHALLYASKSRSGGGPPLSLCIMTTDDDQYYGKFIEEYNFTEKRENLAHARSDVHQALLLRPSLINRWEGPGYEAKIRSNINRRLSR